MAVPIQKPAHQQSAFQHHAYDARFRRLVGEEGWANIPEAVRRRFSKRLAGHHVALYRGEVVAARFSLAGRIFAQLLRVIGAPLPLSREVGVPAMVSVSEDARSGGQVWSRMYGRRNGFPQVIHSAKRFGGSSGLEEYLGFGIGMALNVEAKDDGLRFVSDHYWLRLFGRRWRWPRWLAPGQCVIGHHDEGAGCFLFSLSLRHPLLGELVHQEARFEDA